MPCELKTGEVNKEYRAARPYLNGHNNNELSLTVRRIRITLHRHPLHIKGALERRLLLEVIQVLALVAVDPW